MLDTQDLFLFRRVEDEDGNPYEIVGLNISCDRDGNVDGTVQLSSLDSGSTLVQTVDEMFCDFDPLREDVLQEDLQQDDEDFFDDEESDITATLTPKTTKATITPKESTAEATLAPKDTGVTARIREQGSAVALPTEKTSLRRDSAGNICW